MLDSHVTGLASDGLILDSYVLAYIILYRSMLFIVSGWCGLQSQWIRSTTGIVEIHQFVPRIFSVILTNSHCLYTDSKRMWSRVAQNMSAIKPILLKISSHSIFQTPLHYLGKHFLLYHSDLLIRWSYWRCAAGADDTVHTACWLKQFRYMTAQTMLSFV